MRDSDTIENARRALGEDLAGLRAVLRRLRCGRSARAAVREGYLRLCPGYGGPAPLRIDGRFRWPRSPCRSRAVQLAGTFRQ